MIIRRGDIYYADLRPVVGSEQGGVRPVLIIQNDVGNKHSPTVICAAITSKMNKAKLPTHVELDTRRCDMHIDTTMKKRTTHYFASGLKFGCFQCPTIDRKSVV